MNDTLKELFTAYKNLPVGVIFFKHEKLIFVNDHLRSVLLLENLTGDDIVQIISSMIGLEASLDLSLIQFFSENEFFIYHDRIIQIARKKVDDIDIFVLIRLSVKTIDCVPPFLRLQSEKTTVVPTINYDKYEILQKTLGEWKNEHFPSIALYKGIPIKGDTIVLEEKEGLLIKLKVEKKQLVAAQIGTQWIVGTKRETMLSGEISRYNLNDRSVWLDNLKIVSQGFYMRSVIRYEAEENDRINISIGGKKFSLPLRKVSEKAISIQTDDTASLVALSTIGGKTLDAKLLLAGKIISVKAVWLYTIELDGSLMKVVFTIGYDLDNGAHIRDWLSGEQLRIIKEVQNFVQMLPPPEREIPEDWVI
ncbi:MAG: hypothetical protein WC680_03230 [Sulfuricurvum sp.]|jgi:hypothetical protein